ncbi:hypothetical protein [Pseudomonas sp.]|uniref:hypothetical protein n=1 Tax=Pseudomonas sp. TaxID=306 RepID=UPI003FD6F524
MVTPIPQGLQVPPLTNLSQIGTTVGTSLLGGGAKNQPPDQTLGGVIPTATSPTVDPYGIKSVNAQSMLNAANLLANVTPSPAAPATGPISADQYRSTGVGGAGRGGQIVARTGPNGEPQFSNLPADQQAAQGLGQISVNPAQGAGTPQPNASLSSLGSAGNLGDGIGTFSQAPPGDAALSADRFARANELRQGYANQDRLSQALGAQFSADHTNVVHDSSKQLTDGQRQSDLGLQQTRAAADGKVSLSQAMLGSSIQNRAGEQQLKQTSSLNDLRATASLPGATADQQNKYLAAADPKAYLQAQQKAPLNALEIQGKQLENQQKAQSIVQTTNSQQQEQQDRAKGQAGQIATIDQAITSVDSLLGTKIDPKNPNGPRLDEDPGLTKSLGPIDGLIPSAPGTQGADFKARLDTLKAQTFLPQVALLKGAGALSDAEGKKLSDSVGALSTSMSEGAFRKSLSDIRTSFAAARERAATGLVAGSGGFAAPGAQPTAPVRAPTGAAAAVLAPVQISTNAAYLALPSGAQYIDPQGNHRSKP